MIPRFARTVDRAARSHRFAWTYEIHKNSSYGKFLTPQIDVPESTSEPDCELSRIISLLFLFAKSFYLVHSYLIMPVSKNPLTIFPPWERVEEEVPYLDSRVRKNENIAPGKSNHIESAPSAR